MNENDEWQLIKNLPQEAFFMMVQLAIWTNKGCEQFDLELAYQDDDIMMFRRKTPLSKQIERKE